MPLKNLVMPAAGIAEAHVARIIAPYVRYDTNSDAVVMLPAALARADAQRLLLHLVALLGWRAVKAHDTPPATAAPAELAAALHMEVGRVHMLLDSLRQRGLVRFVDGRFGADPQRLAAIERVVSVSTDPITSGLPSQRTDTDPAAQTRTASAASRGREQTERSADTGRSAPGATPIMRIRALIREGWFETPRTANELLMELRRRGAPYRPTDLTRQLLILSRGRELLREKAQPPGAPREVWTYVSP